MPWVEGGHPKGSALGFHPALSSSLLGLPSALCKRCLNPSVAVGQPLLRGLSANKSDLPLVREQVYLLPTQSGFCTGLLK